jgi:hypothetical protein
MFNIKPPVQEQYIIQGSRGDMTCIEINNRTKTPTPRFLDEFSFDTFTYREQSFAGISLLEMSF